MKKSIIAVSLILSLVILVSAQLSKLVQESLEDKKQESPKKCGAVVEGLQFCTTSPVVSVKLGEDILISLGLQNVSEKTITILTSGGFYQFYNVTVKDSEGNKILSRLEIVQQKIRNEEATEKELLQFIHAGSNRLGFETSLAPKEELRVVYNFNYFYDFKTKGKYQIEISEKVSKKEGKGSVLTASPNASSNIKISEIEIPLGTTIEIEVK